MPQAPSGRNKQSLATFQHVAHLPNSSLPLPVVPSPHATGPKLPPHPVGSRRSSARARDPPSRHRLERPTRYVAALKPTRGRQWGCRESGCRLAAPGTAWAHACEAFGASRLRVPRLKAVVLRNAERLVAFHVTSIFPATLSNFPTHRAMPSAICSCVAPWICHAEVRRGSATNLVMTKLPP